MNKILVIDGNSMLFRAYYGTMSRGYMKSSSGVVTNAVFGFSTMLDKAIEITKPTHILVAFDTKDKTFRHNMFSDYKGTRKEVDEELVSQFALVREFLDSYPIKRFELSGYEADDIIGTMSNKFPNDRIEILTSDRDMLQLIAPNTDVLLMKKGLTEIKTMTTEALYEEMEITPSQIVDIKALMGDTSDNIPGVPSIGEKTALKLIKEYGTFENLYNHKEDIKGKMGEKLREFEDQARMSYDLAKIETEVPFELELEEIAYTAPLQTLNAFYRKYDMNSLITEDYETEEVKEDIEIVLSEFDSSWLKEVTNLHPDLDKKQQLRGVYLVSDNKFAYLTLAEMVTRTEFKELLNCDGEIICSDSKPIYRFALEYHMTVTTKVQDLSLLSFIVDSSITTLDKMKDEYNLWFEAYDEEKRDYLLTQSLKSLFETLITKADNDDVVHVYQDIELPLVSILAACEYRGIHVDQSVLDRIADETKEKIDRLQDEIFGYVEGEPFNLNSPKQLAEVLFDKLGLPTKKKRSTAVDVLESLEPEHPIIAPILEYRKYQKLYSTYAIGLVKHISSDMKIHTTYNQHATQTGRLSSSEPNLQNISVRDEETREIRKAFVASEGSTLVSIDYSQIELRVLSYLADEKQMLDAFNNDKDIHTETAKAIFGTDEITSLMRRQAKSVNFGIVYGMSGFGLSKQLDIPVKEATQFINRYNEIYPNITKYMDEVVIDCEENGYVKTLFNRRRYITEIYDKNRAVKEFGKRAAMNAPIQGTAADIIKLAMIKAEKTLHDNQFESKMILQVHDELIFDVKDEELDRVVPMMVEVMENIVDWPVKLKVSVATGKNWFED